MALTKAQQAEREQNLCEICEGESQAETEVATEVKGDVQVTIWLCDNCYDAEMPDPDIIYTRKSTGMGYFTA